MKEHPTENLFYSVIDREALLKDCPAISTLLLNVCDHDKAKFEEACRLVSLFMEAAYELGKKNSGA